MSFIIKIAQLVSRKKYEKIFKALPKTFDVLIFGVTTSKGFAKKVKTTFNSIRA